MGALFRIAAKQELCPNCPGFGWLMPASGGLQESNLDKLPTRTIRRRSVRYWAVGSCPHLARDAGSPTSRAGSRGFLALPPTARLCPAGGCFIAQDFGLVRSPEYVGRAYAVGVLLLIVHSV